MFKVLVKVATVQNAMEGAEVGEEGLAAVGLGREHLLLMAFWQPKKRKKLSVKLWIFVMFKVFVKVATVQMAMEGVEVGEEGLAAVGLEREHLLLVAVASQRREKIWA